MRRVVLLGIVLLSVVPFSFLAVSPIERKVLSPDGTTALAAATKPAQQVEITNFPAVQAVGGTVDVGNLPLDSSGSVRVTGMVSSPPREVHFIGITTATFLAAFNNSTPLPLSRGCNAEFPGTRLCDPSEVVRTIPPPDPWAQPAIWVGNLGLSCMNTDGGVIGQCTGDFPAACCGF